MKTNLIILEVNELFCENKCLKNLSSTEIVNKEYHSSTYLDIFDEMEYLSCYVCFIHKTSDK